MGKIASAAFQLNDSGTPIHMLTGDGQQVAVITAVTDAVTGAVSEFSGGNAVFPIFLPTTLDTAGISAAALAASNAGGGTVVLPQGRIVLTGPLPMYSNVQYVGQGWSVDGAYAPVFTKGTWLSGDGTFPCFYGVGLAGGSAAQATLGDLSYPTANAATWIDLMFYDAAIRNIGMYNFSWGIKIGAKNNSGMYGGILSNIMAHSCTQWGIWAENFLDSKFERLYSYFNANGMAFVASGNTNTPFGDSHIDSVHPYQNRYVGLGMYARSASVLNDTHLSGVHAIGPAPPTNYTNSLTGASAFTASMSATASIAANACTGYINTGGVADVYLTLTVASNVYPGMALSGTGISSSTIIKAQISGTPNGAGVYEINVAQLVASSGSPQTINVGGVLSGAGYAIDMMLTAPSVNSADVNGNLNYIIAGSGSTWYTFNPAAQSSTTIYGLTPAIAVPDLSQFKINQPVCFTTAGNPNGFTTRAVYFVRTMSAASGAGTITLSLRRHSQAAIGDGPSAAFIAPKGSTAQTTSVIATTGFPVVEIASLDHGSRLESCDMKGASDIESGGTTRLLIQGIGAGSGSFEIGTVAANANAYSSVALRACSNLVLINRYSNLILDSDLAAYCVEGMLPTTIIGTNNGGTGFRQDPTTNFGQLWLSGYQTADFKYASGIISMGSNSLANPVARKTVTGNLDNTAQHIVFTGAAGQTLTLQAVAATNIGMLVTISNASANTVTIGTTSSQNIVGLGASGTSISLATLTGALLVAQYDGSAYYWARLA